MYIREYDGGDRGVEITQAGGFVIIEAAGHAYALDRAIFLHGVKKALGIALVI